MPPSFAAASASLLTRAWLWAVTIRSVSLSDFRSHHELGIGLHGHLDAGGVRRGGQPVLGVGDHHPDDLDAVFSQHVERRHAEMAGADEGNPHDGVPSLGQAVKGSPRLRR